MALSFPYAFSPGTDILSAQVNANFDEALHAVDKRGDTLTGNLSADSGVTVDGVDISAVLGTGGTLPAVNGAALTNLSAANITAGGTLPALDGSALTNLTATNLSSGTVPTARLGSGTASATALLTGANTWVTAVPYCTSGSGTITLSAADGYEQFVNCTGTATVNLYAASGHAGYKVQVKLTAGATVTIDGNASETIDGQLTVTLLQTYQNLTLLCDGTNWHLI